MNFCIHCGASLSGRKPVADAWVANARPDDEAAFGGVEPIQLPNAHEIGSVLIGGLLRNIPELLTIKGCLFWLNLVCIFGFFVWVVATIIVYPP